MTKDPREKLFPVSSSAYAEAVGTFSGFTDDELRLLEAANDTLLPDDNPTHFVLQLNMRPDLRADDSEEGKLREHAYRVGVLLGRRVIKNSIELSDGEEFVRMSEIQKTVILNKVAKKGSFIPSQERNFRGFLDRRLAQNDPTYGFYPYVLPESEVLQAGLRGVWLRAGLPFFTKEAIEHHIDDEIPKGLKDLFRVYALLDDDPDKKWRPKQSNKTEEDHIATDSGFSEVTETSEQEFMKTASGEDELIEKLELKEEEDDLTEFQRQLLIEMRDFQANIAQIRRTEGVSILVGKLTVPLVVAPSVVSFLATLPAHNPFAMTAIGLTAGGITYGAIRAIPWAEDRIRGRRIE